MEKLFNYSAKGMPQKRLRKFLISGSTKHSVRAKGCLWKNETQTLL